MDAQIELNSSIESTIEKEKSEYTLFDMAIFNLSKGKRKVLRVLLKALGIEFKENVPVSVKEESPYDPEFVRKIKRGEKAMREKRGVKVDLNNLWGEK